MKVAIVHYWLVTMRGGEKVVEALCKLYPQADIFTHVHDPSAMSPIIRNHRIRTTFVQKFPGAVKHYQKYLPFMPMALEQLDLRGYDLVISSESGPAKGVLTSPGTTHICYCHTPMRYIWDMYQEYRASAGWFTRLVMPPLAHYIRNWDVVASKRPDYYVANSETVAARIAKHYRRDSVVINPPVATSRFEISDTVDESYLCVGQLIDYKRMDLAVEACTRMGRKLTVVGQGDRLESLKAMAGPTVTFLERVSGDRLNSLYSRCKALLFPGEEDFGIVPVEAMAAGRPVIAFGRGGATETVMDGRTGLHFPEQNVESLMTAIKDFETRENDFNPVAIREHALGFDDTVFAEKIAAFVTQCMEKQ